MKINSYIKTKTSISKLNNYLSTQSVSSTLLKINQPFVLYPSWWYEKYTSKILHKYWANFPSDLDNFSLSASIMYQNWWIKFKANPNDKNKDQSGRGKENKIKLQFWSFHFIFWLAALHISQGLHSKRKANTTSLSNCKIQTQSLMHLQL